MIGEARWRPRGLAFVFWCGLALAGSSGCAHHGPSTAVAPAAHAATVASLPQVGNDARVEFEEGLRLMRLGPKHHEAARAHLGRASELDPKFFEAWHNLGYLEASRGNLGKASAAFERALEIQPGARPTILALGEVWRRQGQYKKAVKLFGDRLRSNPEDMELRTWYLQSLRQSGALDEALAETRLLLVQGGEHGAQTVLAYNSLGLIYHQMGKFELAEKALRKAVDLDPKSAYVWTNLGLVAYARGRDQEAFLDFQKATSLDPKYMQARMNKAAIYMDCGDYRHARVELEKAVDIDPGDVDARVALGVAARGDGKTEEARQSYEKALEIQPENPAALYDLGVLFMDFDKVPGKAQKFLAQYVDLVGEDDSRRQDAQIRLNELAKAQKGAEK